MERSALRINRSDDQRVCSLAHLSDFHFVGELTESGRRLWTKGVKSHSFAKIDALSQEFYEFRRLDSYPDVIVVTGDVSTDGSTQSLETALGFIQGSEIFKGVPGRLITTGLCASPDRRIIIPGNHDRYGFGLLPLQRTSDALESVFSTSREYPYVVVYHPTYDNHTPLLFFLFDSTLPKWVSAPPWNRVAQGWIQPAE